MTVGGGGPSLPSTGSPGLAQASEGTRGREAGAPEGEVKENLLSPEVVRRLILERTRPLAPRPVPLAEAAGLVVAERVAAPFDLPRFPNAAMDGFAVRAADTGSAPVRLRLAGEAPAGHPWAGLVGAGEAVAIATGGVLPKGADSVVPVEEAEARGGFILVTRPTEPGRHVRRRGEDLREGEVVLEPGSVLGPGQLAAAAALGRTELRVHPRPRVAVLPSGDEIRPPGAPLGPGQVYDAVSVPLTALLLEAGCLPQPRPVASDDPARLAEAIRAASEGADAVLTVGGVSAGGRDPVPDLDVPGEILSVRLALRPAKPFAFGRAFGVPLFGLPGNPASALVAFEELVRPALLAMLGRRPGLRPARRATLAQPIVQRPGRLHLVRAWAWEEEGRLRVRPAGRQGAGMIHSLGRANAWAVIPADATEVPVGTEVEVRMMAEGWW